MKIALHRIRLAGRQGEIQRRHSCTDLAAKFKPDKVSPFYFELLPDGYEAAEGIAITAERVLDLLIFDMDKIEGRLSVAEDESEKAALAKMPTRTWKPNSRFAIWKWTKLSASL